MLKGFVLINAFLLLISLQSLQAKPTPNKNLTESNITTNLLAGFKVHHKEGEQLTKFKNRVLSYGGKAVPALIKVMKTSVFPEKSRWVATFLLGKIMGKKASPFIRKFVEHPHWVLRMASLKTLLALGEKRYTKSYAEALEDKSLLVRTQALQNVRSLKLRSLAPNVWAMLYNEHNYYRPKDGAKKRQNIIKDIVKTIGDLKFKKATDPLLKMVQKKKYDDIFDEIVYSLEKITGKSSPDGARHIKRIFWQRVARAHATL